MLITRTSAFTGITHTRDIPGVTQERLDRCWKFRTDGQGDHIQVVFPELSADDREFLISGVTPEEWAQAFGSDDDE